MLLSKKPSEDNRSSARVKTKLLTPSSRDVRKSQNDFNRASMNPWVDDYDKSEVRTVSMDKQSEFESQLK